jgi:DNA-binding response OmpR family regulator
MSRILVIDDSEVTRNRIKQILDKIKHDIFLAADAFAARDCLDNHKIDLVLLDLNMPNKGGFTLLKELRSSLTLRHVPIAIISARQEARDVKRAAELGALTYIVKPIDEKVLLEKVTTLLKQNNYRSRLEREISPDRDDAVAILKLQSEAKITKVTDIGVVVESSLPIEEGGQLVLVSPLLNAIGLDSTIMDVLAVTTIDKRYQAKLAFKQLKAQEVHQLETWLRLGTFDRFDPTGTN